MYIQDTWRFLASRRPKPTFTTVCVCLVRQLPDEDVADDPGQHPQHPAQGQLGRLGRDARASRLTPGRRHARQAAQRLHPLRGQAAPAEDGRAPANGHLS